MEDSEPGTDFVELPPPVFAWQEKGLRRLAGMTTGRRRRVVRSSRQQTAVAVGDGGSGRRSGEMGRFRRDFISRRGNTCSGKWVSTKEVLVTGGRTGLTLLGLGSQLRAANSPFSFGNAGFGWSLLHRQGTTTAQGPTSRPRSLGVTCDIRASPRPFGRSPRGQSDRSQTWLISLHV